MTDTTLPPALPTALQMMDSTFLQTQINALQERVAALEAEIKNLRQWKALGRKKR